MNYPSFLDTLILSKKERGEDFPTPDGIFDIQNVADYYYEVDKYGKLDYQDDVISYRLPFKLSWFEFTIPKNSRLGDKLIPNKSAGAPIGILGIEAESKQLLRITFIVFGIRPVEDAQIADFLVSKDFICDIQGKYLGRKLKDREDLMESYVEYLKTRGHNINWQNKELPDAKEFSPMLVRTELTDHVYQLIEFIVPVLYALNFMHCKNVSSQENMYKLPRPARRRGEKSYFEKYYTLHIDTMKKILKSEGQIQSTGLKNALHICRGHFKTYNDKGLFGKYQGTYWWPSLVRGSKDVGVIEKDYDI